MTTEMVRGVFEHLRKTGELKTKTAFGERLGFGHSFASLLLNGKTTVPNDLEHRIKKEFPKVDLAKIEPVPLPEDVNGVSNDVQVLNRTADPTRQVRTNKHGNRFVLLSDGTWLVYHKHVLGPAHAAYEAGWGDEEYVESLPERSTIVPEYSEDLFISFTVTGECQDDGTLDGIAPGMEITGQSLSRSMWQYGLPFEPPVKKKLTVKKGNKEIDLGDKSPRYRYWVIINQVKGMRIAMIKNQDVEKGILHGCCRNPDRETYPDFEIKLSECNQIFRVIKRVMNG